MNATTTTEPHLHRHARRGFLRCSFLTAMASLCLAACGWAGTYSASDDASLRNAINNSNANPGSTINLTGNITIGSNLPDINASVTINAGGYLVSGGSHLRISEVNGGPVAFDRLFYTGGTQLWAGVLEAGFDETPGVTSFISFHGGRLRYTAGEADYSALIAGSSEPVRIDTNGRVVFFDAPLTSSNSGGLQKLGAGILLLRAANTYGGFTTVSAGVLVADNPASLPGGPVSLLTDGVLFLPFDGTTTISELYINGSPCPGGTWGSPNSAAINKTGLITGTGILNVLGKQPRLVAEQPATVPVSGGVGFVANPETKTFTLKNTGETFLVINSISVTGGDAANFSVDTAGMSNPIDVGASTTFTVTFSSLNNVRSNTTLRINSTDADFPLYDIALNGNVPENVPPTISAGPLYVATSSIGATVNYPPPVVSDNTGATPTVTYSIPSGSFFPLGTTTVTATATDISGNTAATTFTVLVQASRVAKEVGGSFGPYNLAPAGTAFAKDNIGISPHSIAAVNDGVYGNNSSWIGASDDTFVGVSLGAIPTAVKSIAWGRDNTGAQTDRTTGIYVIQATTVPNPNAATPEANWTTMGIVSSFGELANPHQRRLYNFTPFLATGIRLKTLVPPGGQRLAIDELEVYQAGLASFGAGVYPVAEGGSFAPENLAAGKTAFAKDSFGAPYLPGRLNDLTYGEPNSWAAGTADSFVGINLGARPVSINRVAFGRDNTGTISDRVFGLYTLQYTAMPNPDETTSDASWITLGTVRYNHDEPGFSSPGQRHEFSFPRVQATGFRLKTLAAGAPIAIDELELHLTPGLTLTNLSLTREGGVADTARNLAAGKTAFAKDEIGLTPHATHQVNDGIYGNSKSWIGGTADTFIGIDLGESRVIDRVAFGRDNADSATQFTHRDRTSGTYILQYTTVADPNASTPDANWNTIGSAQFGDGGEPNFTNPALRHEFTFTGVAATGFRIKVQPTLPSFDGLIAIDELEIYGPYELNGGNIALVAEFGSIQPNNLAAGKTAFAKDVLNEPLNAIAWVNDGVYGGFNGWVAGSGDSFIGINLGARPISLNRVAFGRDNTGGFQDRVYGTYTLQYTTVPSPDESTADASWTTIGTIRYNNTGGPNFAGPRVRHEFTFDRVEATGFRLKTLASYSGDIAIDELELYGPRGLETTGGITLAARGGTFLANNLAAGKTAFAIDEIGVPPHTSAKVNDGLYGNANSWVAGSQHSGAGVDFGTGIEIQRIAFGRDNTGTLLDRCLGTYTLQYTTDAAPDDWLTIGSITYRFPAYDFTTPSLRHEYAFPAVTARKFRLLVSAVGSDSTNYIGIDELEVYGRFELLTADPVDLGPNLATGKTTFAKDALPIAPHEIGNVNNLSYGNASAWIANSTNSFVGINLGATPVLVSHIAFGRDNLAGGATDRALGSYTVQYTTDPNPNASTTNWASIANVDYGTSGNFSVANPARRHLFSFSPVLATGIRLAVNGAFDGFNYYMAIDELELYGLTARESWRLEFFGSRANSGNGADSFDADHDGLINLVEYAFGLDPLTASTLAQVEYPAGYGDMGYVFIGLPGVTYEAESSTDLIEWTPVTDTGFEELHTFTIPIDGPKKFIRMRVTSQ